MKPLLRRPLVAGNWKLFKNLADSCELASAVAELVETSTPAAEVVIAPVFTALSRVADVIAGRPVSLAAQNMYWEEEGAYTGEVGPLQLVDLGCSYVILGHSERRQRFGDTDETVQRKTRAALQHELRPIVCVGETLAEREAGKAEAVVVRQVRGALAGLSASDVGSVVIAYEPVWAIGTGKNASPQDAQDMHARIRATFAEVFDEPLAQGMRVLYGGSVKPENAKALMSQPDIDGALVGGASLKADSFGAIVAATR